MLSTSSASSDEETFTKEGIQQAYEANVLSTPERDAKLHALRGDADAAQADPMSMRGGQLVQDNRGLFVPIAGPFMSRKAAEQAAKEPGRIVHGNNMGMWSWNHKEQGPHKSLHCNFHMECPVQLRARGTGRNWCLEVKTSVQHSLTIKEWKRKNAALTNKEVEAVKEGLKEGKKHKEVKEELWLQHGAASKESALLVAILFVTSSLPHVYLHVYLMFTSCLPHVYLMFTSCSLMYVYLMFTSCLPHVYLMLTSCLPDAYLMLKCLPHVCLPHVYLMFTSYLPHVYLMFTSCLPYVYLMPPPPPSPPSPPSLPPPPPLLPPPPPSVSLAAAPDHKVSPAPGAAEGHQSGRSIPPVVTQWSPGESTERSARLPHHQMSVGR